MSRVVITKHKDDTYSISNGSDQRHDQSLPQVIAVSFWNHGIRRDIITNALKFLSSSNNDVIIFHNDTDYVFEKIDYSKMLT